MLPKALLKTQDEIEEIARQFAIQYDFNYKTSLNLYSVVKKMNGDVITKSSKFSLIVHDENDFEIYLSPYTTLFYDNVCIAQTIGHYVLHYLNQIDSHSDGFVCKKNLNVHDKNELNVFKEAYWFQQELLLPKKEFVEFYTKNDVQKTMEEFSLPLRYIQMRAKSLGLIRE
jgi:hypothetical protein